MGGQSMDLFGPNTDANVALKASSPPNRAHTWLQMWHQVWSRAFRCYLNSETSTENFQSASQKVLAVIPFEIYSHVQMDIFSLQSHPPVTVDPQGMKELEMQPICLISSPHLLWSLLYSAVWWARSFLPQLRVVQFDRWCHSNIRRWSTWSSNNQLISHASKHFWTPANQVIGNISEDPFGPVWSPFYLPIDGIVYDVGDWHVGVV